MKIASTLMVLCCAAGLTGCYSSRDNELVGQPKKVVNVTPILCSDRSDLDISLGVLRNGVGSMSTADEWLTVQRQQDVDTLNKAVVDGKLVRVKYDVHRFAWCWNNNVVSDVQILQSDPQTGK
jgi:hypothetical protein